MLERLVAICIVFLAGRRSAEYHFPERGTSNSTAVLLQSNRSKKGMPSWAARGYRKSGQTVVGERHGAKLDGRELRGKDSISWHRLHGQPILLRLLQYGMLISRVVFGSYTVLLHCFSSTSYSSVFLSRYMLSFTRIPARSLLCSRSGCCVFREGCLRELVHSRQVFVRGWSPRTRAASYSRRVFDWGGWYRL